MLDASGQGLVYVYARETREQTDITMYGEVESGGGGGTYSTAAVYLWW